MLQLMKLGILGFDLSEISSHKKRDNFIVSFISSFAIEVEEEEFQTMG